MRRLTALRPVTVLIAALLMSAACERSTPVPTMSRAEAEERVESYIREAAARLRPTPKMEISSRNEIPCTQPGSKNDGDVYAVEHTYWLSEFPAEAHPQALETLRAYWTGNGYRIRKEERDSGGALTGVSANHTADNFFVRIWQNPAGDLYLVASSTCVSDDPPR